MQIGMKIPFEQPHHFGDEIQPSEEDRMLLKRQWLDAKTRSQDWNEKAILALRYGQLELAATALEGRRKEEIRRRQLQHRLLSTEVVCEQMKGEDPRI